MNRDEFLRELSRELRRLPRDEYEKAVKFPSKREKTLKYALQNVKNHPLGLLFSRKILNLSQNKSKIFNAS